jgi:hypothetical protein
MEGLGMARSQGSAAPRIWLRAARNFSASCSLGLPEMETAGAGAPAVVNVKGMSVVCVDQAADLRTFIACSPFGPLVMSKSTVCP